jgi:multiple sugar transport system ATP-binding protein
MASLVLRDVSKLHGERRTVAHVDFEARDGEFVVLVGPSGCGKSTLLRMVAGLESVSEGDVLLDGRRVNDVPGRDRDVAMVFQNYALYPHMSVRDNLGFALRMRGLPRTEIEARVLAAAEALELSALLARKPAQLSGGQRQRVAVGRAIVRQPRLFLFDEPLSNLDAKLRVAMRAELIRLHRRLRATMLYVTHDQVEAMSMADRLVVLRDGVVQQIGAPLEVYDRPANRFVAGFIGSPPMNFLEGRLDAGAEGLRFACEGLGLALPEPARAALTARGAAGGRAVTLGLRPEDVHEPRAFDAGAGAATVAARVEFVEAMGNEVMAACRLAGRELTVRLSPRTPLRADTDAELVLDLSRAHLFDAESGERLA